MRLVIAAATVFLVFLFLSSNDPWVRLGCTFLAVLFALYGDYARELRAPIRIQIGVPERSNNIFDMMDIEGAPQHVCCHHLEVRNLTVHKPIRECRVWLKRIFTQNLNGEWKEEATFAVPRLMRWASSEYPEDKRSFRTAQLLELGHTIGNDKGFQVSVNSRQGGSFIRRFGVGKRIRFVLFVTAKYYRTEREFCFEVAVPSSTRGSPVTPATVVLVGENTLVA